MEINEEEDDAFEVIDSHYELIESTRVENTSRIKSANSYEVSIKPTKNEVDLNIMENQYYQFEVKKRNEHYCTVERRFSDFELIFEVRQLLPRFCQERKEASSSLPSPKMESLPS